VDGGHERAGAGGPEELDGRSAAFALRERLTSVYCEAASAGERLDRLDTAPVRAREDSIDRPTLEPADEALRLPDALLVERSEPVVARPPAPVAG
jgi:hypothetical protein